MSQSPPPDGAEKTYGGGISDEVVALRDHLARHNTEQADRYWSRHNIDDLLSDRCAFFDSLITDVWRQHLPEKAAGELCLLAVGGYGRGELFPQSDIDLLIIGKRPHRYAAEIAAFLHVLYDLNLEVGHSVRRLAECRQLARDDITIATAMFERRVLAGSEKLAAKLTRILQSARFWPAERFFRAKRDEQLDRHRQFDNVDYGLEPNIKSSPGGLRDLQTVLWVCLRQFEHRRAKSARAVRYAEPAGTSMARGRPSLSMVGSLRPAPGRRTQRGPAAVRVSTRAGGTARVRRHRCQTRCRAIHEPLLSTRAGAAGG